MKAISGESASVTNQMTAPWNETTLPTLLSNYKLGDMHIQHRQVWSLLPVFTVQIILPGWRSVLEERTAK